MAPGLLQDTAAGRPEAEQEDYVPAAGQCQSGGQERDEQPGLQPGPGRREPVFFLRRVRHEAGLRARVPECAQLAPEQGRYDGLGREEHDQYGAGADPPLQRALAPPQEHQAEDEAQHPVVADDVARHQQGGVQEPDDDQPQTAPAQDPGGAPLGVAGRGLPEEELHHPVAEEEREERIDPQVQHDDHGELHRVVEPRAVRGLPAGGPAPGRPEVEGGVGQNNEQQHDPAREVGCERPLLGPHAPASHRRLFARGCHDPTLGRA